MKCAREFLTTMLVGGLLVVLPIYLTVLVLLKGMQSAAALVRPFTMLLPSWLPAEDVLSLALVLVVCFLIGVAVRTRIGMAIRHHMDRSLLERLPGYTLFRSLTQRFAGEGREHVWKPALVEIEEPLSPPPSSKNSRTPCQRPRRTESLYRPGAGVGATQARE